MSQPIIEAHRGARIETPENTLLAFKRAVALKADSIELDVHLSADGIPVVIHDATLDRTTAARGDVAARRADELCGLDAGVTFAAEFAGEPIPTLAAALELLAPAPIRLNIEIKKQPAGVDAATPTVKLLQKYDKVASYLISSFWLDTLLTARAAEPAITLALIGKCEEILPLAIEHRIPWIHCGYPSLTRQQVVAAHAAGINVGVWTVNDPLQVAYWAGAGVQRIITDDPRTMLALNLPR